MASSETPFAREESDMPTPTCARTIENLEACGSVAFAFAAAQWGHVAASVHDSLPLILQILGGLAAFTTIYRNIAAVVKGKP